MGLSLTYKILTNHLVEGELKAGQEIGIRIDQTLTQDATGTMAYLQFEAMGLPKVRTECSVSYVDHNTLQTGFENMDDHLFLQSFAEKYGIYFSKPGNGICHQVHLERFGVPGKTLLGSDSHTPTGGGMGMIAIGAGGLDVAAAMAGGPFYLTTPEVLGIRLTGQLGPWVSAKDVILEVLRRMGVKGGVGRIIEYFGPGVRTLHVPERATITNMGAETGATTSIFPSDEITRAYLCMQGREKDWRPLAADKEAVYDEVIAIDLNTLEPLVACPHSPDNVEKVRDMKEVEVRQVNIGSCTNSSYKDLMAVAEILRGEKIHPKVCLSITPGSRQVLEMLAQNGALADLVRAGARILEPACDGCLGMGSAPGTGVHSVRTYNRNFPGRSGTKGDRVYLVSPETAAATALYGELTDPRVLGDYPQIEWPERFSVDDGMILPPEEDLDTVEVIRGPNIQPFPLKGPLEEDLSGEVLLKVGDHITTDHIMPAGAKILPLRSNIPAISEFVYRDVDPDFVTRIKEKGGGFIVGGENYGQGSSREHAALAPMYLGLKVVVAKSFARIHKANLINVGILPLEFEHPVDYERIEQGDRLSFQDIRQSLVRGPILVRNVTRGVEIPLKADLSDRHRKILIAGGLLNLIRERGL